MSHANCPGPSLAISLQFTLKMSDAAENRQKNLLKPLIWRFKVIQGHRR